ncbi:amino acid oxidase [Streptomyces abyssalis]|uniref:D-amino-acid oxidase n=1 Tax=Streptomyces abyssalis TaxID=933944 RepID=A0A1E7JSI0_9ACTN|nr:FAD-dependent oxidoreductase [Streptomyces abyssalis]OEU91852.1 amino acid oxidase [Streptomyces abyssalis]OEU94008.1 amino acid oxidase [Streptomyces abyssalis]
MDEVIVVGGGVSGLTTAVLLAERGLKVRVWSRNLDADTASGVSGGLCWPYRIEPQEKALEWAVRSFRNFAWLAEQPAHTGVRLVRGTLEGGAAASVPPEWISLIGSPPRTPIVDMLTYLPYLRGRLTAAGGSWEQRRIGSLAEASARAEAVVDCSGLGARELAGDTGMRPVRGQIVVVENPGVEEWFLSSEAGVPETTYVLPQPYGLLLGGTADEDAEETTPDPATTRAIVERCARVHPALAGARILEERVGLRPYRPRVRLEAETLPDGTPCVHNYGHGGAGVTVSWGCALEAVRLLRPDGGGGHGGDGGVPAADG